MATLKSQNDRLLVVCEADAPLPSLGKASPGIITTAGGLHRNLTVVSQFHDEERAAFAERVMGRVTRDLQQSVVYRGVVIAISGHTHEPLKDERLTLVNSLAGSLTLRPKSLLMLCAPVAAEPDLKLQLLELAGSVALGAPNLDVKIVFPNGRSTKTRKRAKSSHVYSFDA